MEILKDYLERNGISYEERWRCSDSATMINVIRNNFGIGLAPKMLIKEGLENGELWALEVEGCNLYQDLYFVYHKDKYFTANMKKFGAIITAGC